MPGTIEGSRRLKEIKGEFDFAVDGGAVSTITLRASSDDVIGNQMPIGSYIEDGFIEVLTPVTSGGAATIAVTSGEAAGDLLAAALVSGAPWSTAGLKSLVQTGAGANIIKTTAARSIQIVIAAAALTAGKFRVVLLVR